MRHKEAGKGGKRDKPSMDRFDCHGVLSLKVTEFRDSMWVELSLTHAIEHKQYFLITIPDDVLHYIKGNHRLSMKDVCSISISISIEQQWRNPPFTRRAVAFHWNKLRKSAWQLDADPVASANLLLDHAKETDGLSPGSYPIERIVIEPEPGWEIISFVIPGILEKYGSKMREFLLDSTCSSFCLNSLSSYADCT